jgi:hypothetical protein
MEQTFINVINQVGFPIAACIMMWYTNQKTLKALEDERAAHKEEVQQTTNAINKLSDVLGQMNAKLDAK